MERDERERRRDTFLDDAADYAAVRPGYPDEALRAAVALAGLEPGDALLEVGCGTGQATRWFAEEGFSVLALERSEEMASLAAGVLAPYARVELRRQDFEELEPAEPYAALLLATSYHWLDPADRADRCAAHLRPGGALILLWHTHPAPFTGFFERVGPIYRRYVEGWQPPPSPGMAEERIRAICAELDASGPFAPAVRRSFDWSRTYETDAYRRLLCTYSDHRLLPEATLAALLDEVGALIEAEFGGRVERPYRTELVVSRTAPWAP